MKENGHHSTSHMALVELLVSVVVFLHVTQHIAQSGKTHLNRNGLSKVPVYLLMKENGHHSTSHMALVELLLSVVVFLHVTQHIAQSGKTHLNHNGLSKVPVYLLMKKNGHHSTSHMALVELLLSVVVFLHVTQHIAQSGKTHLNRNGLSKVPVYLLMKENGHHSTSHMALVELLVSVVVFLHVTQHIAQSGKTHLNHNGLSKVPVYLLMKENGHHSTSHMALVELLVSVVVFLHVTQHIAQSGKTHLNCNGLSKVPVYLLMKENGHHSTSPMALVELLLSVVVFLHVTQHIAQSIMVIVMAQFIIT